jgi:hypothetical protein
MTRIFSFTTALLRIHSGGAAPVVRPLQVFNLAGQSNMQGQGMVTAQIKDGGEKPGRLLAMLRDALGKGMKTLLPK